MADSVGAYLSPLPCPTMNLSSSSQANIFLIDRVFVHALNTVKKIPKTGASRPPPADRLRLYGLYKQAMEGDVDGVMERPVSADGGEEEPDETRKDRDKYDAWDAQKGISRTEAKRRYIEALIETMHRYASTTADARALVDELEFVWDQIKNNSASSSNSSPGRGVPSYTTQPRQFQQPLSGNDGPMRVLSPMSQDDEAERRSGYNDVYDQDEDDEEDGFGATEKKDAKTSRWRRSVEHAFTKMTAEIAALREQISTGREWQGKKRRSVKSWVAWVLWLAIRHMLVDVMLLSILLLWMRKKNDRRIEDLVREGLRIGREYVRNILPAR
ncbi:related to endozepine [Rhynchosporium secalis]|uniref:Related to endozepine n=1 Tax=Rhynchosporium secalis TaxID=38038 RepID=A0A1E1MIL1_RHYSE|nr:related to endozepine [Rhynchosporium secalis]